MLNIVFVGLLASQVALASPPKESNPMERLIGTWVYANDPTGAVPFDNLYKGSTMTFEKGGAYRYQMGGTSFSLDGTAKLRSASSSKMILDIDYGSGRTNVYHIQIRPSGGFRVDQGEDGKAGAAYYVKQ